MADPAAVYPPAPLCRCIQQWAPLKRHKCPPSPGKVTVRQVIEKYFVAAGFAFVHADSTTDVCAVEAVKIEELDPEAVRAGLTEYTAKLASLQARTCATPSTEKPTVLPLGALCQTSDRGLQMRPSHKVRTCHSTSDSVLDARLTISSPACRDSRPRCMSSWSRYPAVISVCMPSVAQSPDLLLSEWRNANQAAALSR